MSVPIILIHTICPKQSQHKQQRDKAILLNKGLQWQTRITQTFPLRTQRKVLNILGLLILHCFSKLTYQEVITMLNLDLNKSVAGREVRQMAMERGLAKGLAKGLIRGIQGMILDTLEERFGQVSKLLSNQIQQIQQQEQLKQLHQLALRCQNVNQFRQLLMAQAK